MGRVPVYETCSPIYGGGKNSTSCIQQIQYQRAYYVLVLFVCQMKINFIFIFYFSYFLSYQFFFLPSFMDQVYSTSGFFI